MEIIIAIIGAGIGLLIQFFLIRAAVKSALDSVLGSNPTAFGAKQPPALAAQGVVRHVRCPKCGEDNRSSRVLCISCGSRLS